MNELLPIIRRKRRPLLPVESLPEAPPVTVPVVDVAQPAPPPIGQSLLTSTPTKENLSDDEAA